MSEREERFVSTGRLPPSDDVQLILEAAFDHGSLDETGTVSPIYPALAAADPDRFGLCLVNTSGTEYSVGDADHEFTIMSVSKPFVFALVCEAIGATAARELLGVNATGLAFNALTAIERGDEGRTNPMVNPGAIMTTSLVPGRSSERRWQRIVDGLSDFAGHRLEVDDDVYRSAAASNSRNRGMASVLHGMGRMYCDPVEAVDLYTRQCSLRVTARDLAVMGATLADGGLNPVTGVAVVEPWVCHYVLAVMATSGLYETSGDWLYEIGLPGKSGIGGGIVTVSPGKGGLGTFAPRLDAAGNSVKGQLATRYLAQRLGMDLFISSRHATHRPRRPDS